MSDLKNREQLRDDIASMLELSRASWKAHQEQEEAEEVLEELERQEHPFPRSALIRTVTKHPALSAASAAALWYFGPAKFGTMAVAGVSVFMRYKMSLLPIAQHLITSALFGQKKDRTER